jgi:predicted lipoprotein with Yx(FWY)xxD motif
MKRLLPPLTLLLLVLTLTACGDDDDEATPASDMPTEEAVESPATGGAGSGGAAVPERTGVTITTADSQFGSILFDGDDRAIYYFDKEASEESECYGDCAEAWPPVLTEGEPEAGGAADVQLLGTTERDDDSTQVTYDGNPLYYYVDDPAGEALCHNVDEFGGLWLVVEPGGAAVQ